MEELDKETMSGSGAGPGVVMVDTLLKVLIKGRRDSLPLSRKDCPVLTRRLS